MNIYNVITLIDGELRSADAFTGKKAATNEFCRLYNHFLGKTCDISEPGSQETAADQGYAEFCGGYYRIYLVKTELSKERMAKIHAHLQRHRRQ